MGQTLTAIYERGTLVLDEPLEVSEGTKVEFFIVDKGDEPKENKRTAAEILAEIAALPLEGSA